MGKVLVSETYLQNIADAIREKTGSSNTYKPSEMSAAVESLTFTSDVTFDFNAETGLLTMTTDNIMSASVDSDGYLEVTV